MSLQVVICVTLPKIINDQSFGAGIGGVMNTFSF